jgi:hypothetical protein
MVATGTGLARVLHVEDPDVLQPVLEIVEHRLVEHHQEVAVGQRQAVVGSALERRRPVAVDDQLGLAAVGHVHHHEAGVAPGAPGDVAMHDRVVQAEFGARRPARRFAGCEVHAGQPVAPGFTRVGRVGHVDRHEDEIGKTVEQRRDIGPAPAGPPDAVDAAGDRHEADTPRLARLRDIVDGKPGIPGLFRRRYRRAERAPAEAL